MRIKTLVELDTLKISQATLEACLEYLDKDDWYNKKLVINAIGDIRRSLKYEEKGLIVMKRNIESKLREDIRKLLADGANRLESCKKLAIKYKAEKVSKEEIEILWSDMRVATEKECPEYKKEMEMADKKRNTRKINDIKSKLKLVQATYEGEKGTYNIADGKVTINKNEFRTAEDVEKFKTAVINELMIGINELLAVMKLAQEMM